MKPPPCKFDRRDLGVCSSKGQQFGDKPEEGTLIELFVRSLEISLKWSQQDSAYDEREQQSCHPLLDVLSVASPTQGKHTCRTGNQEEQWYSPRADHEHDGCDSVALFRVFNVPVECIERMQSVKEEDSKYEEYAQPIEIMKAA